MNKLIALLVLFITITTSASDVFKLGPGWTKVQDGEVTQWSTLKKNEKTRVDLISYMEDKTRITYYLVRTETNGRVKTSIIKAGNKLGVGVDNNRLVAKKADVLDGLDKLPEEAAKLLN